MKIFYSHTAINDLKRLREFIAKENPTAANEIANRLLAAIKRLIDFPLMGKSIHYYYESDKLRDLVTGRYTVRYLILKKEIHILKIWHNKENRLT